MQGTGGQVQHWIQAPAEESLASWREHSFPFTVFLGCAAVALPSSDIASSSETDKPQPDCPPEKVDQIRESLWDLKQEIGTETTPQETEPRTE